MVQLKKKVTLKKKVATPLWRTKTKIWFLCTLLVVVAVVAYLFLREDSSYAETLNVSTNEVVAPSIQTSDSVDSIKQKVSVIEDIVAENAKSESNLQINPSSINSSTEYIEQMAWSVIRGSYDNNPIRRQKLGKDYQVIQDKVNELYRKGLVH